MGLDYLHRVCQIIHTDLKPENVSLCLTPQELAGIQKKGYLKTTKMYADGNQAATRLKKSVNASKARGRGANEDYSTAKLDK